MRKKEGDALLKFVLPEELWIALMRDATRQGISAAEWGRRAVRNELKRGRSRDKATAA